MVVLPENFVKLADYQGYFVNLADRSVYSIKSGILRPLARSKPSYFNHQFDGWVISNSGRKVYIVNDAVVKICGQAVNNQVIEVGDRLKRVKK